MPSARGHGGIVARAGVCEAVAYVAATAVGRGRWRVVVEGERVGVDRCAPSDRSELDMRRAVGSRVDAGELTVG